MRLDTSQNITVSVRRTSFKAASAPYAGSEAFDFSISNDKCVYAVNVPTIRAGAKSRGASSFVVLYDTETGREVSVYDVG